MERFIGKGVNALHMDRFFVAGTWSAIVVGAPSRPPTLSGGQKKGTRTPAEVVKTLLSEEDDKRVFAIRKKANVSNWKNQLKKNLMRRKRLKDISNQRKETKRHVPTKNSQAYDCRHQYLRPKTPSNKTLTIQAK